MLNPRFYTGLKQLANGREIVVYGTGRNTYLCLGEILKNCTISFFVSNDINVGNSFCGFPHYTLEGVTLTPEKHLVIVTPDLTRFAEIRTNLERLGFVLWEDYFDCCRELELSAPFSTMLDSLGGGGLFMASSPTFPIFTVIRG